MLRHDMNRAGDLGMLPPEILHLVSKSLCTADLSSLSRACTLLRHQILPRLYQEIRFKTAQRYRRQFMASIIRLFRSIYMDGDLARLVQHVSVGKQVDDEHLHDYLHDQQDRKGEKDEASLLWSNDIPQHYLDCAMACVAAMNLSAEDADKWVERLYSGVASSWTALLLSRLSQLISLSIGSGFIAANLIISKSFLATAINTAGNMQNGSSPFQYLRKISVPYETHFITAIPIYRLLEFPLLHELHAVILQKSIKMETLERIPTNSSLKTLILRQCNIRFRFLGIILQKFPNLQVLHYEFWQNEGLSDPISDSIESLSELSLALQPVKQSLQRLKISIPGGTEPRRPRWSEQTRTSFWSSHNRTISLHDFMRLQILDIPMILLGWDPYLAPKLHDILPPNVRELRFQHDIMSWPDYKWMIRIRPEGDTPMKHLARTQFLVARPFLDHLQEYLNPEARQSSQLTSISVSQRIKIPWGDDYGYIRRFRYLCEEAKITGKIVVDTLPSFANFEPLRSRRPIPESLPRSSTSQSVDKVIRDAMTYFFHEPNSRLKVQEIMIYDAQGQTHLDAHRVVQTLIDVDESANLRPL